MECEFKDFEMDKKLNYLFEVTKYLYDSEKTNH